MGKVRMMTTATTAMVTVMLRRVDKEKEAAVAGTGVVEGVGVVREAAVGRGRREVCRIQNHHQ